MSPPFLLKTDGRSRQTGMCITVFRRCSKFAASAVQRRDSVAFFFIMTMPVSTQQQQRLTFSMRARYSCCRTHRIRRAPLPSFRFPEVKKQLKGKMHVERSRGLLKTHPSQLGLRSGTSSFTAWQSAKLLKDGSLIKWSNPLSFECNQ